MVLPHFYTPCNFILHLKNRDLDGGGTICKCYEAGNDLPQYFHMFKYYL